MSTAKVQRKLHRLGAFLIFVPLLVVLVTGLLLQVRKEFEWIQPSEVRGAGGAPTLTLARTLEAARAADVGIETWDDVDRVEFRPAKGLLKVRATNRMEVQIDAATGDVLKTARRNSDLIESIHEGTWFHPRARTWIFLPAAVILFGLWCTGLYLWLLPHLARYRKRHSLFG